MDWREHREIRSVGLTDITVLTFRRRAIRRDTVDALADSMRDRGLINPITLRPREEPGYYLIAGGHRYEAARKLNWENIPAIVLEGLDAVEAELCEIDENLVRAELSPAEQAGHHARRKELYQRKHPETKKGAVGRGRKKSQVATTNEPAPAFIDETARKTGKDRSTVARAVRRGVDIPNVAELAGTSLDQGVELDALAKLGEIAPERQVELIEKAKNGERVSARDEVKKVNRDEGELGVKQLSVPNRGGEIPHHRSHVGKNGVKQPSTRPARKSMSPAPGTSRKMRSPQVEISNEEFQPSLPFELPHAPSLVPKPPPPPKAKAAMRSDPVATQRASIRGAVIGVGKIAGVDFDQVATLMPIDQLLAARSELDQAAQIIADWRDALDAALDRAASAEAAPEPSAQAKTPASPEHYGVR